jgi:hypothetical protein
VAVGSATRKRDGDETKEPTTTMTHKKLNAAFLQGGPAKRPKYPMN